MNFPNPKKFQQQLIFYILFFSCHYGRGHLYEVTQSTFEVVTEYDGTQYVKQAINEIDENHGPDDPPSNDGRMYVIPGKLPGIFIKSCVQ